MAKTGEQISEDLTRLLMGENLGNALHGILLTMLGILSCCQTSQESEELWEKFIAGVDNSFPAVKKNIEDRLASAKIN